VATQAQAEVTPRLWFWPWLPTKTSSLDWRWAWEMRPGQPSHCGWQIGEAYISAVPNMGPPAAGEAPGRAYPILQRPSIFRDRAVFGSNAYMIPMKVRLNTDAMVARGEEIVESNEYQLPSAERILAMDDKGLGSDPPYNNAVVAFLVLYAGMPAEHQRYFRRKYFRAPEPSRWGRSPFWNKWFSVPENVKAYCHAYNTTGRPP
jgi:hypothetical protein